MLQQLSRVPPALCVLRKILAPAVPCLFNLKGTFFAFCAAKMDNFISSLAYCADIIAIYIAWSHQMNNIWTAGLEMGKSNWYNFQSKAINTHAQSFLPPFHSSVALGEDVNLWVTLISLCISTVNHLYTQRHRKITDLQISWILFFRAGGDLFRCINQQRRFTRLNRCKRSVKKT